MFIALWNVGGVLHRSKGILDNAIFDIAFQFEGNRWIDHNRESFGILFGEIIALIIDLLIPLSLIKKFIWNGFGIKFSVISYNAYFPGATCIQFLGYDPYWTIWLLLA